MKKVIRLTESDLTRIVRQAIQEKQVNESKKLKTLALGLGLTVSTLLPSCGTNDEEQIRKFQKKLYEINQSTPEGQIEILLKNIETSDVMRQAFGDEQDFNRMVARIYASEAEEHLDLCAKMIAYQLDKCGEGKRVKVDVEKYVNKLKGGDLDKVDLMIIQCFEQGIESKQKEMEYAY